MYIPDAEWDALMNRATDILNYLDDLFQNEPACPESRRFSNTRYLLHAFVNLEDAPLPPQKRKKLNAFQKRRQGHDLMRKFTKYFLVRWAKERIRKFRKHKRKSTNLLKDA